jgi:prepilin-type N-terminal cleavage/methylation domain-containing protein
MRRRLIRKTADARGFTMIELCIVIVVIGILLATGVAALLRARMAANESAAIGGLRATASGQFAYSSGCGRGGYATTYVILGTKPAPNSQGYISEDLGSANTPLKNGYLFSLALGAGGAASFPDCNGNPTQSTYYATATPTVPGQTGDRGFAVNQRGTVYQGFGSTPPDEPFEPPDQLAQ